MLWRHCMLSGCHQSSYSPLVILYSLAGYVNYRVAGYVNSLCEFTSEIAFSIKELAIQYTSAHFPVYIAVNGFSALIETADTCSKGCQHSKELHNYII